LTLTIEQRRTIISEGMLRSCVVLAGANHSLSTWRDGKLLDPDSDGFLMADEAGALDLTGTWLVCLSGCNTAVGADYSGGEGVFGLRRAFVLAGAQNLVLTLWPVEDAFTAQFMEAFYKEALKEPFDAVRALSRVQSRFLRQLRDKVGVTEALRLAGPFLISTAGY
jgi:CHAT domain-containing protein